MVTRRGFVAAVLGIGSVKPLPHTEGSYGQVPTVSPAAFLAPVAAQPLCPLCRTPFKRPLKPLDTLTIAYHAVTCHHCGWEGFAAWEVKAEMYP